LVSSKVYAKFLMSEIVAHIFPPIVIFEYKQNFIF